MIDPWYPQSCRTWNRVLDDSARQHGGRDFLVCGAERVTFKDFRQRVLDLAKGLLHLGVGQGDVVALWMTNRIEWAVCQFATYRVGAMLLPLYSYYRRSELEYALNQAGAHTLIMADTFIGRIDALAILEEAAPDLARQERGHLALQAFPSLRSIVVVGESRALACRHRYEDLMAEGAEAVPDASLLGRDLAVGPFDVMNIMYTSGTTGFPKGGMSMHVTNLSTVTLWSEMAGLTPDDVILCHVPMFTNFGGLYAVGLGLRNGCRTVITEQFDAAVSLELIERERVTYVPGTPSMFRMLLDHEDVRRRNLSSLRGGHVAGAPLTDETMRGIIEVLGARDIMQAWGLSECGGLSTVSTRDHALDKRLHTVGRPLPSSRVCVFDPQTLRPVEAGGSGEIWLGDVHPGSCVGMGYHRMPDKTRTVITDDGWFRTGDVGFFDEEGFLHITGRVDDMFTVGGFNVYPAEIEKTLERLPGVREAYVVPVPDRRLGSVPVAWVSVDGTQPLEEDRVVHWCRSQMTPQKAPRRVFFYTPGELPLTPVGKLKRKELALRSAERVAAQESAAGRSDGRAATRPQSA